LKRLAGRPGLEPG